MRDKSEVNDSQQKLEQAYLKEYLIRLAFYCDFFCLLYDALFLGHLSDHNCPLLVATHAI